MIERENQIVMLGGDYPLHGRVSHRALPSGTACAISAGATEKRGKHAPNEDALMALDDGQVAILAVADGHFGIGASHDLVCALAERITTHHRGLKSLMTLVEGLADRRATRSPGASESTFVVAAIDRASGAAAAVSYGDSSLARLSRAQTCVFPREHASHFVSLAAPATLASHLADTYEFRVRPGDLVAVFTDGIDACRPGDAHDVRATAAMLQAIHNPADPSPATFTRALTTAALRGWRGHPGAVDNVAVVVARV